LTSSFPSIFSTRRIYRKISLNANFNISICINVNIY